MFPAVRTLLIPLLLSLRMAGAGPPADGIEGVALAPSSGPLEGALLSAPLRVGNSAGVRLRYVLTSSPAGVLQVLTAGLGNPTHAAQSTQQEVKAGRGEVELRFSTTCAAGRPIEPVVLSRVRVRLKGTDGRVLAERTETVSLTFRCDPPRVAPITR